MPQKSYTCCYRNLLKFFETALCRLQFTYQLDCSNSKWLETDQRKLCPHSLFYTMPDVNSLFIGLKTLS